jgi:hypothetical protein
MQTERRPERERDAHRHEAGERRGAADGARAHSPASVTSRQFIERGFRERRQACVSLSSPYWPVTTARMLSSTRTSLGPTMPVCGLHAVIRVGVGVPIVVGSNSWL